MANICPNCNSADTQTLVHQNQCLNCGKLFGFDGKPVESGLRGDPVGRRLAEQSLKPREYVVAGNIADLQRWGAERAVSGEGTLPQGTDPDSVTTPAQAAANRGEENRETVRAGLKVGDEVTPASPDTGKKSRKR